MFYCHFVKRKLKIQSFLISASYNSLGLLCELTSIALNMRRYIILLVVCVLSGTVYSQTWDENAVCEKTETGFNCTCNLGYEGSASGCININECSIPDICKNGEDCTDLPGSYVCHCGDTEECATTARCESFNGTKSCRCVGGYHGNGTLCEDIDECAHEETCDDNANCANTEGSYICTCNTGYIGSGTNCTDFDECETGNHSCVTPLTCSNTQGGYDCTCGAEATCGNNEKCVVSGESSACVCIDGYAVSGGVCTDLDECGSVGACDVNANCTNVIGSFICTCKAGYTGTGVACEDVNECETDNHTCVLPLTCNNTQGNYSCLCGDGKNCYVEAECLAIGNASRCVCNEGYTGDGAFCNDVNECSDSVANVCTENANCTNTLGSYTCACLEGYQGDGMVCSSDSATVSTVSMTLLFLVVSNVLYSF